MMRLHYYGRVAVLGLGLVALTASAQPRAWFVDGYHGGIYGHYPTNFTQFIVDTMHKYPEWKMNLEIEPVTWDFVRTNTPEAYAAFKELAADQSTAGRIEFVNPAYGQSYFWMASGESMIQQFDLGIRKMREHFTNATFRTFSSEEPCFTSAMPGVLKSFGFESAVLKNPNTCWGGYTRAFGGECVNWIGPDGTAIRTVPRYGVEALQPGKTWETIGNANSPRYIQAALDAGIQHPVGMCLQDAGWRNGPWLKRNSDVYSPTEYTTWRNYFENVAVRSPQQDWHLSQEDIQVSLVWGSQVLQRIAQQVRQAESHVIAAEKLAAIAGEYRRFAWPETEFDAAWKSLLLSQHHDCWIVPYNGRRNNTWADKVAVWTQNTMRRSDSVVQDAMRSLAPESNSNSTLGIRVFNTLGTARTNLARVKLPPDWRGTPVVSDAQGNTLLSQVVDGGDGSKQLLFAAPVPAMGFNTFRLSSSAANRPHTPLATVSSDGCTVIETEVYHLELDPSRGGTISSLVAKQSGNQELVDVPSERRFNEVRGFFPDDGCFHSTADHRATIEVLESGPLRVRVRINGEIASNAFTQVLTLQTNQRLIECALHIDWRGNVHVGSDYGRGVPYHPEQDRKAFYADQFKLQAIFPTPWKQQRVFKDAPFDVTESRLADTHYDSWSGIKNNIVLNWVDVFAPDKQMGFALFSDHVTSYTQGTDTPLGLTLLYSGVGLWGVNYRVHGPTDVKYAWAPHSGNWSAAGICDESDKWLEPLSATLFHVASESKDWSKSLLAFDQPGWQVPAMRWNNGTLIIRVFNPTQSTSTRCLTFDGPVSKVEWVQLDGTVLKSLPTERTSLGRTSFEATLPAFGVGTVRIVP